LGVTLDERLSKQMAYHAMANMPKEILRDFLADPIGFANGFHRVGEVPAITADQEG
jgi:hypothetical protein